uniref:RRM domain-containing protein n=1 Tax=Octactis speculum TaxID=3111310 RepID=A0A7S2BS43_9STRA|mmetsp:Transcript_26608/g.36583  ORF Transcript_26608/g.36583 Transcript_26608/m.36583 type:complete len:720 (+) Transcript_26608:207-2366(+)|eukprot:CAMPEP_0185751734 /NCGR_PEP_ID=MMETSP1174-20130828/10520_1 /TAXON_ID=35687 /ORGANISM="Dictyocha speculum, Strain CCMP1381" /LENGTH=719 /DNA_ID=CAMNT_0028428865 /DNA_START=207 /DNA_END=2366 /DNA_ORIENTATION=+
MADLNGSQEPLSVPCGNQEEDFRISFGDMIISADQAEPGIIEGEPSESQNITAFQEMPAQEGAIGLDETSPNTGQVHLLGSHAISSIGSSAPPSQVEAAQAVLEVLPATRGDNSPSISRSIFVGSLKGGYDTYYELCMLANSFGALESISINASKYIAFLNFVDHTAAADLLECCCKQPAYIGHTPIFVNIAKPPAIVPWLRQHIVAGATRNLFMAHYGSDSRFEEIRAMFLQFCDVVEMVVKGSYIFIHTCSIAEAVQAKSHLEGMLIGGRPIVLKYAKEKGAHREGGKIPVMFSKPHMLRQPSQPNSVNQYPPRFVSKNLHVSKYGKGTTATDLRTLFGKHCVVTDVIMKDGYAFINTSSVEGAMEARQKLHKTMIGKSEIRVNLAREKKGEGAMKTATKDHNLAGHKNRNFSADQNSQSSFDGASDSDGGQPSRGSFPSRNLHVSNYGPGTRRGHIMTAFEPYCDIRAIVIKTGYCFVNTFSVECALKAKTSLQGTSINGRAIRINFAKDIGHMPYPEFQRRQQQQPMMAVHPSLQYMNPAAGNGSFGLGGGGAAYPMGYEHHGHVYPHPYQGFPVMQPPGGYHHHQAYMPQQHQWRHGPHHPQQGSMISSVLVPHETQVHTLEHQQQQQLLSPNQNPMEGVVEVHTLEQQQQQQQQPLSPIQNPMEGSLANDWPEIFSVEAMTSGPSDAQPQQPTFPDREEAVVRTQNSKEEVRE